MPQWTFRFKDRHHWTYTTKNVPNLPQHQVQDQKLHAISNYEKLPEAPEVSVDPPVVNPGVKGALAQEIFH